MQVAMQRILLAAGIIVFVAAAAVGATGAFFSDTETSTGNTFTAGALDLKVDSEAHYNGSICTLGDHDDNDGTPDTYQWVGGTEYPVGLPCSGTWTESDLIPDSLAFRFFDFSDLKPGDEGENTISLHVYDNDAWGCMLVDNVSDLDVTCTEPEGESTDPECSVNVDLPGQGELGAALSFDAWLDEGGVAGFQCNNPAVPATAGARCAADPLEGDNIMNGVEGLFWNDETVDEASEGPFALAEVLGGAYVAHSCSDTDGSTGYAACHGLASDGRMVGSTTYYWGLAWNIPEQAGNEIQTDELVLDMVFEVEQHRHNEQFSCTPRTPDPIVTTLTLAKTVIPALLHPDSAYTLSADGAVTDISGIEGAVGVTNAPIDAGVYTLSESSAFPGAAVAWECIGNATPVVNNGDGTATLTVAAGETVGCAVTNNYQQT